jgi:hypothetical protein
MGAGAYHAGSHHEHVVLGIELWAHRRILLINVDISDIGIEEALAKYLRGWRPFQAHQQTPFALATLMHWRRRRSHAIQYHTELPPYPEQLDHR